MCLTLAANSSKVSFVMFRAVASLFSCRLMRWNKFPMGFISGLRGGIEGNFARIDFIAILAAALFWLGYPSCN